jgi:hypothetical protein
MIEHTTDQCPVPPNSLVRYDLGDGRLYVKRAGGIAWGPGAGPDGEGRVLRYEVLAQLDATDWLH